jgi:ribosomal protein S18 acetylase RimI-like enzyme
MPISLRPAQDQDFAYCWTVYTAGSTWMIRSLNLDTGAQAEHFRKTWSARETRIIRFEGADIGWLQSRPQDGTVFLAQFFIDPVLQNRGIGTTVMKQVLGEAAESNRAVTLGVVRINPAMSFYKRLGFYITHEDGDKAYMRREPGLNAPIANLRK